ncbi:MAG: primosomal protein N', partial [Caulobacteraceae bacterium]
MSFVARVLLPLPLPEAFDYAVPEEISLAVGDHVAAPLGPRMVRGVVTELRDAHGVNRPLKPISARLEDTALPANTLAFVDWAARYACEPPGEALAMALRGLRARQPAPERLVQA